MLKVSSNPNLSKCTSWLRNTPINLSTDVALTVEKTKIICQKKRKNVARPLACKWGNFVVLKFHTVVEKLHFFPVGYFFQSPSIVPTVVMAYIHAHIFISLYRQHNSTPVRGEQP